MKNVYENQNEAQWSELVIERAIVVPDEDFEQLIQPMDNEQSSIEQDTDDYYKQYHCIMVTGQNRTDCMLLDCDRYIASYALDMSALGYPSLAAFIRSLTSAVGSIIENGICQAKDLEFKLSYDELENYTGLCLKSNPILKDVIRNMLCDKQEIASVVLDDEYLQVTYSESEDIQLEDKDTSFTPRMNL